METSEKYKKMCFLRKICIYIINLPQTDSELELPINFYYITKGYSVVTVAVAAIFSLFVERDDGGVMYVLGYCFFFPELH